MSIIIVPAEMLAKLIQYNAPVELCTADGHFLGHFMPAKEDKKYNFNEPLLTQEEFEARIAAGGGRKLADIIRDLEARG